MTAITTSSPTSAPVMRSLEVRRSTGQPFTIMPTMPMLRSPTDAAATPSQNNTRQNTVFDRVDMGQF